MSDAFSKAPVIGQPSGISDNIHVYFTQGKHASQVENHGNRVIWCRAIECSCVGGSGSTNQPKPTCKFCHGKGVRYFRPSDYVVKEDLTGSLNALQKQTIDAYNGAVIRGYISRVSQVGQPVNDIGMWMNGQSYISVQGPNRLGYYDRIINLDSYVPFTEVVDSPNPSEPFDLRYYAISLNMVSAIFDDNELVDYTNEDLELRDGRLYWKATSQRIPAEGSRISVHYQIFPVWLVISQPHAFRTTELRSNVTGKPERYASPVQALIQYEHLAYAEQEESS